MNRSALKSHIKARKRSRPKTAPATALSPADFARQHLAFHPDPLQELVLNSTSKNGILNCCRQWGKSTVTAAKAVHRAYTHPDSLILLASPTARQNTEFLNKVRDFLRRLQISPRRDGAHAVSARLPNGSRIVGIPALEANVRGFSAVSLILIDEAARVPDELYKALRPMLAISQGDLWMMSTPRGTRGFFWETWTSGADTAGVPFHKISVPATDCPRIPPEFLAAEEAILGSAFFQQEYLCRFIESGSQWFSRESLDETLIDAPLLEI
jgi:hypothetical protein